MVGTSYSTPLVGLDAVVLDTETTGLDARTARVVQIGVVRMHGPKLLSHERLSALVNLGC
jgi:DNA polymerase-3 subunit epsilon/CBS domain-containing protein